LYKKIPWDVLWKDGISVTWPVPWDDLTLATLDAAKLEKALFEKIGLTKQLFDRFKVFGLFGIRRPLLVYPSKIKYTWRWKILFLAFDLSSGSYATVLIDEIEKILRWWWPLPEKVDSKEFDKSNSKKWNTTVLSKKQRHQNLKERLLNLELTHIQDKRSTPIKLKQEHLELKRKLKEKVNIQREDLLYLRKRKNSM
jgi:tRNA pseudouridine synthase D (TruD)